MTPHVPGLVAYCMPLIVVYGRGLWQLIKCMNTFFPLYIGNKVFAYYNEEKKFDFQMKK